MKCSDYEELLLAYASNELPNDQREFIEQHLTDCAECKKALEGYARVGQHLKTLNDVQHNPNLQQAVMAKIKGVNITSNKPKWLRPALISIPVVVIMIILFIIQPWNPTDNPKSLLADIITAAENIQSYKVEGYSSSSRVDKPELEPAIREETWEFVLPDRVYAILSNSYNSTSNGVVTRIEESVEVYIIGENLYYLTNDNIDMFLDEINMFLYTGAIPTKEYTLGLLQFAFELKKLPDESIDGVDYLHYKGTSKMGDIPLEIWIDKEESLVRQITQDWEDERMKSFNSTRFYDFNTDITIEPPLTATGELLPGWEVMQIEAPMSQIPVHEALAAFSGDEDWTDPSVLQKALEMMARVTDPLSYFNALPQEAQEALGDILSGDDEEHIVTITQEVSFSYDDDNGVVRYTNSGNGLDVIINTGYVDTESGEVTLETTELVDLWVSTIYATDPQDYFDALPEGTKQQMAIALSDRSIFSLVMNALD